MERWFNNLLDAIREVFLPKRLVFAGVDSGGKINQKENLSPLLFAEGENKGGDEEDDENPSDDGDDPSEDEDKDDDDEDEDPEEEEDEDPKDEFEGKTDADLKKMILSGRLKLKSANKESAGRRKKLSRFEKEKKETARKKMSEIERLKAEQKDSEEEITELKSEVRTHKIQQEVGNTVLKVDKVEYVLIDSTDFLMPEDGKVKEIPDLLATLFEKKSHLFQPLEDEDKDDDSGDNRYETPRKGKKRGKSKGKHEITFSRRNRL